MPKKKQVTFQNSIQGKFIPRNTPPPGSVFPSRVNDNRFNAKMAELLASSSTINDENELVSTKSSQDDSTSNEILSINSSRIQSKLFHRRIVTMLETLKKSNDNSSISPVRSSNTEYKSQPITFGQLRQATISSVSTQIIDEKSISHQIKKDTEENHDETLISFVKDNNPNLISTKSKSSTKGEINKEQLYYSTSLKQLLEQQNVVTETKDDNQQIQKSTLTVDEILAMYYSKVKQSTNIESNLLPSSSTYSNTHVTNFHILPSVPKWNSSENNQHIIPPPQLVLNKQNRNRPPPPSYSSSITNTHRTTSNMTNPVQRLIHPPVSSSSFEHFYSGSSISQHLLRGNSSFILSNSSTSHAPIMKNAISNNSIRLPPPRYQSPPSNVERSHSTSSQQSKTVNNSSVVFDHEFSRLLYGKDTGKTRRQKQKRKAFSDPVKKSIEEASRSLEKTHRRITPNLNKTHQVKEEEEGENDAEIETKTDRKDIHKQELNFPSQRRSQRKSNLSENNLIPANSLLKQRIPSFLRVYSQASPSNDILLQWHLFNLSELESFNTMMSRLYKNENLARVQLYEIYRTALLSMLASKKSLNTNSDNDANTTIVS